MAGGIGGAEAPDAAPVKKERDQIIGLPLATPDEVLTIDGDFNSATVYAAVDQQTPGIVRVDLSAELLGIRRVVASAFVVQGWNGPIITATGIAVDGWHVSAAASSPAVRLKVGISARRCCSGFGVFVPSELLVFPLAFVGEGGQTVIDGLNGITTGTKPPGIFPWGNRQGQYALQTNVANPNGGFAFLPGTRILHCRAIGENQGGLVTFTQASGGQTVLGLTPNMGANMWGLEIHPEGALAATRVDWINLQSIAVESVR
jgi:hypothetical protein